MYLGVRHLLLGTIGSYRIPDLSLAVHNLGSGPWHVFGLLDLPAPADGAIMASIGAVALLFAGMALSVAARHTRETALLRSGLALAGIFNIPLAFASGRTRVHLLILGISLAWTASIGLLSRLVPRRPPRVVLVVVGLVWLWLLYDASRALAADFSPCSDFTLSTDEQVITWPMVSAETRTALMDKRASCRATTGLLIRPALEPRPAAPRR